MESKISEFSESAPFISVLDEIERKLESMNETGYILRAFYAGEHNFENPEKTLKRHFEENIKRVNSSYCDAAAHGFVLIYQNHFFVVVESSEDVVYRQIKFIMFDDENKNNFGRTKLLMVHHNISKRLFPTWEFLFATPATLGSKLLENAPAEYHFEILKACVKKIEGVYFFTKMNQELNTIMADYNGKNDNFPECALLDYILNSKHVMELKDYIDLYENLPDYVYSFEKCWPAPYDFTPELNNLLIDKPFIQPLPVESEDEEEKVEDDQKQEKNNENNKHV